MTTLNMTPISDHLSPKTYKKWHLDSNEAEPPPFAHRHLRAGHRRRGASPRHGGRLRGAAPRRHRERLGVGRLRRRRVAGPGAGASGAGEAGVGRDGESEGG